MPDDEREREGTPGGDDGSSGEKEKGIGGPFPGGPRRPSETEKDPEFRPARVGTGEEEEAARDTWVERRKAERRKRRIVIGVVGFVIVATGAGVWLGLDAVKSAEEIVQEEERAEEGSPVESIIERERSRILQELWKMEEVERAPRPPGR